ncbi:MAG TPA: tyrosine-type recombinase/integrase [Thermomicrobiales bacterium]|nr:tyrosine-type recombinase/integrase [Thermomicrobiales bacterium]
MYVHSEHPLTTTEPDDASSAMTVQDAHRRFIDEDLRLSPRSRRTYDYSLRCFLEFVERDFGLVASTSPVTELKIEHVTAFVSAMMPRDLRQPEEVSRMRTVQTQLAAIRKWYAYLAAYDFHPDLPTDKLRTRVSAMLPRFSPPPPDIQLADLERIIRYVRDLPHETKPALELRRLKIRAMVLFLYRTGVRVSELCALRRRDVDIENGTAGIYRAKGGKSRTVLFDNESAEALVAYWTARGDGGRGIGAHPAFSGRDKLGVPGAAISPRTVEHIVSQLCVGAGVEAEITPHSFRHGLASELVRRRVRESTVQTLLGHASPATTRIYVHKTAQEVSDEYQEAFGTYRKPDGA